MISQIYTDLNILFVNPDNSRSLPITLCRNPTLKSLHFVFFPLYQIIVSKKYFPNHLILYNLYWITIVHAHFRYRCIDILRYKHPFRSFLADNRLCIQGHLKPPNVTSAKMWQRRWRFQSWWKKKGQQIYYNCPHGLTGDFRVYLLRYSCRGDRATYFS